MRKKTEFQDFIMMLCYNTTSCLQHKALLNLSICLYTSLMKKPQITEDLCTAAAAGQTNIISGLVEEPCFLKLKEEEQEKSLLQLSQAETDDDRQPAKELLVFRFLRTRWTFFLMSFRTKGLSELTACLWRFYLF